LPFDNFQWEKSIMINTPAGYMAAANAALSFTKAKMVYGSSNDVRKITGPVSFVKNIGVGFINQIARNEADVEIDRLRVADYDTRRQMEIWAEKAEKYGAGNCGEQSAIAFVHLRKKSVEPITWTRWSSGNHAFVLLGKPQNGTAKNVNDWIKGVVVCDPWKGVAGFLEQLPAYPVKNMTFMLHSEGGVVV
jgi:hypothetical protein